jgi:hypothetical protein
MNKDYLIGDMLKLLEEVLDSERCICGEAELPEGDCLHCAIESTVKQARAVLNE